VIFWLKNAASTLQCSEIRTFARNGAIPREQHRFPSGGGTRPRKGSRATGCIPRGGTGLRCL
jgi:hypothetical protein